ncbi:hypothetical protein N5C81_27460 [Rhizobium pusense]|nr:hypothetical protein [Agrobacterium pusense]MDH1271337.1 hypothetical protein [Agrobacterium pusense]
MALIKTSDTLGVFPASHCCVIKEIMIESQNKGNNRKKRDTKNLTMPDPIGPVRPLGITKPLIMKNIVTPILPKSNKCDTLRIQKPLLFNPDANPA